jgi:branched-chain amino acid transport system permease protein
MANGSRALPLSIIGVVTFLLIALPAERARSFSAVVNFLVPFLATVAVFAIICIGLNIQWGYTGIFNFGVLAFFMIGAYTAAIFTKGPAEGEFVSYVGGFGDALADVLPFVNSGEWFPFLVALIVAAAISGLLALLLAGPTLRLREDYLAIAIIGVAELLRRIVIEEQGLVNGARGITGIPGPFRGLVSAGNYKFVYLVIAIVALVLIFIAVELGIRSPWGRVLRALREDEDATSASGKNVFAFKMQGFVFGAAIMGAGGALFGFQQGAASPDTFTHFFATFIFWAMLIVGGSGNTLGAVAGAYIIWGFWSITLQIQGYDLPDVIAGRIFYVRDLLIGAIIVVVLLYNPRGLLPEQERVSRWLDRRVARLRREETAGD